MQLQYLLFGKEERIVDKVHLRWTGYFSSSREHKGTKFRWNSVTQQKYTQYIDHDHCFLANSSCKSGPAELTCVLRNFRPFSFPFLLYATKLPCKCFIPSSACTRSDQLQSLNRSDSLVLFTRVNRKGQTTDTHSSFPLVLNLILPVISKNTLHKLPWLWRIHKPRMINMGTSFVEDTKTWCAEQSALSKTSV